MYFGHAPKRMFRLSVEYWQDSKIPIRLWKSLVEDTANERTSRRRFQESLKEFVSNRVHLGKAHLF